MKQHFYSPHARALNGELEQHISRETLRGLHYKLPIRHALLALRQFGLLVVCLIGTLWFDAWWAWLPLAVLQGLTIFNFTVLLHEVLHRAVFNDHHPRIERLLALLYAIPSGISPTQFTRWHLDHHAELGSMDDPKRHHLSPKQNKRFVKLLYATPWLFVIYFRAAAKESATYPAAIQQKIRRERLLTIGAHLLTISALLFAYDVTMFIKAYLIPVFFIFPPAFALNRLGQHYAINPADPAQWSTLMVSHPIWNWIFLYSNLHLEHHYFPGVPCYHLPQLQRELSGFYASKKMKPMTYGKLVRGWILHNQAPHSKWAVG
jgi:fatty acid desaturase